MLNIVLLCEVCVIFFLVLPLLQDYCASGLWCLVPALAAQFVESQQPLVVGSASAVTVCPAPAMALQGVWSQSFVPSLLLLFVELPWGLLWHSVTLASCRTLSFCCSSPGFLPLAFVQAWV